MAYGLPVVVTGWSGNTDFVHAHNAALVPFDLARSQVVPTTIELRRSEPDIPEVMDEHLPTGRETAPMAHRLKARRRSKANCRPHWERPFASTMDIRRCRVRRVQLPPKVPIGVVVPKSRDDFVKGLDISRRPRPRC